MKQVQTAAKTAMNGTAKEPTAALKVVKDEPKMLTEKSEASTDTRREGKMKSVKEIIEKNARLTSLIDKHDQLNDTAKKLDSFRFGSDRLMDSLIIRDGTGNEFKTNNTAIITKVVELVKNEVDVKYDEVEKEIQLLAAA